LTNIRQRSVSANSNIPFSTMRATRQQGADRENITATFGSRAARLGGPRGGSRLGGPRATGSFGADITNIAAKADENKLHQQPPQPQKPEPPLVGSIVVVETEATNAQEAKVYADDIDELLFREEATFLPRADYMDMQADLTPKMRMILMDWLIEVHMKYRLRSETLHLAINLIDRYLTKIPIARKRLQLVGVCAMYIAAKFEEISPPELNDWVYITDRAYTKDDVLHMECAMLSALSFRIAAPTAAHFFHGLQEANGCRDVHRSLAQYILELGILDIRLLHCLPSVVVSAALLLSNEILGRRPAWPSVMVQKSRHEELELRSCADLLRELLDADRAGAGGQLQAVHKKFLLVEHHSVASEIFQR